MPSVAEFNISSVRDWTQACPDTSARVQFARNFIAPPRIAHGFRWIAMNNKRDIRVQSTVVDITRDDAEYHITGVGDTPVYNGGVQSFNLAPHDLDFLTGEHTGDLRSNPHSPQSKRIYFKRPFVTPPKVVVFFNYIDLDKNHDWKLKTSASDIDEDGFTLNIETWDDTILYAARAAWIAYPADRPHIFSTSVNTNEIRPWKRGTPSPLRTFISGEHRRSLQHSIGSPLTVATFSA